jgi:hypothetical protein
MVISHGYEVFPENSGAKDINASNEEHDTHRLLLTMDRHTPWLNLPPRSHRETTPPPTRSIIPTRRAVNNGGGHLIP